MTKHVSDNGSSRRLPTGIVSFDMIAKGGLPQNRTTLISGTAGSGKTVFAMQFLAAGIRDAGEHGVFVTFEESAADIRTNMLSFGWDLEAWEREGKFAFVDASPDPTIETVESGELRPGRAARARRARRPEGRRDARVGGLARRGLLAVLRSVDRARASCSASRPRSRRWASPRCSPPSAPRTTGRSRGSASRSSSPTTSWSCATCWRTRDRRRTIEILKFRGTDHQKGEFPFTIVPDGGIIVIPLSAMQLQQKSSNVRISSGNAELDEMCGGGFFRDSVILVSGATGTGKTLTVTQFLQGGAAAGERCLLLAFEESREQLFRNATGGASTSSGWSATGMLRVVCDYPEVAGLEDWLLSHPAHDRRSSSRSASRSTASRRSSASGTIRGVPRVRDRPHVVHQAPGDHRALHVDDVDADGRRRRSPRPTSRRSPTRSSSCATSRCSAR